MSALAIPAATLARMAVAYEAGAPLEAVAAIGGMSKRSVSRHLAGWGWAVRGKGFRAAPWPADGADDLGADASDTVAAAAPLLLRDRLESLVAVRIAALEAEAARGRGIDPEANARAIAVNARTLALLRRLPPEPKDGADADGDAEPPRSLDELRDELRGHLERIAAEERSRRLRRRARPDGNGTVAPALADPLPGEPAPPA